jgi:hypothetical protein
MSISYEYFLCGLFILTCIILYTRQGWLTEAVFVSASAVCLDNELGKMPLAR